MNWSAVLSVSEEITVTSIGFDPLFFPSAWVKPVADPPTTKLYDRRGYNPEKSASFFANY